MLDGFEDEKSTRPFRFERNAKANKSCAMYRLLLGSTFVKLRHSVAKLLFDPKSLRSVLNRDVKEELVIVDFFLNFDADRQSQKPRTEV